MILLKNKLLDKIEVKKQVQALLSNLIKPFLKIYTLICAWL
jgi:hypothetical protein